MEVISVVGSVDVERCVADPQVGRDGGRFRATPGGANRRPFALLASICVLDGMCAR